ncbi:EAL domain-containing protein [Pseudahrensia aquimaris]|uniref:EAL domain-containing protein n=1 Tax=Pseudahrensia aquimaris TaxID=744461 RepID=A0ABW3FGU3_9HYPH
MDRTNILGFTTVIIVAAIGSAALAWLLFATGIASAVVSALFGLVIFTLCYVILRDIQHTSTLKALDARFEAFAEFEADLERRLAQKQDADLGEASERQKKDRVQIGTTMQAMAERMAALEKQINATPAAKVPATTQVEKVSEGHSVSGIVANAAALKKIDLKQALKKDELSIHLQPVVDLAQRRPSNYEALMRLKLPAGDYLDAGQFDKLAKKGGLLPMMNRKLLHASVRMLERLEILNKKAGLFTNVSAELLEDAQAFKEMHGFLQRNKNFADELVIEISQRELRHLKPLAKDRLGQLVDMGFHLSLDEVMDLRLDIAALQRVGFRFVKIPAGILLHASVDEKAPLMPAELANAMKDVDITLIAMDVERENEVLSLLDFQVEFAQGLLFAPPRPIKKELLDGPTLKRDTGS